MPSAADTPGAPAPREPAEGGAAACEGAARDYARAFHDGAIGMLLMAPDGRPLRVNRAFCELTGRTEQEILAGSAAPLHAQDEAVDVRERARCVAGAQSAFRREVRYRRGNGELIWVDQSCTLVRGDRGEPLQFIVQAQDIGGRHGAAALEAHLRETQGLLHMSARLGRLGAWTWLAGEARMRWSDELCRLCEVEVGFAPTLEETGAFFAAEHRALARSALERCLATGEGFDVETPVVTAGGRTRWFRLIGEAERAADGRVHRIHGACQDLTDSRRAAERTRRQARQLTNTLERLTDGFYTLDREWRFTYLNPEVERLVARPREELLGRRITEAFPAPSAGGFLAHYRRALDENAVVQAEEYYEPLDLWVQLKIYPSAQGVAVYVRDITERVRWRQQLLQLNAQLEARVRERTAQLEIANRELEAFSYAIAHDLRAPLSAIHGFSDCLQRLAGDNLDQRGRHYLQRILAGVRHMRELTDGLLSLASLSRPGVRVKPVDLSALAHAAVAGCRERAPQRRAEIAITPGLVVQGDPRLLAHVIENLVSNAWKFTSREPCARIEVGRLDGPGAAYFVRDNGAGFDQAWAGKLFEPFQRLHSQEEFEGTGIGLAIVHKVVLLHGGRVWAESVAGEGATFFFTLG